MPVPLRVFVIARTPVVLLMRLCASHSPSHPAPEFSGAGCEEEKMTDALHKVKLAKLLEIEGYASSDELMAAVFSDSVWGCGISAGRSI
jgi:hypothetical protein